MRSGLFVPIFDELADPWITLAAVATSTERVRLGPMVTPLARRRPVKVARETATLDRLSGGRLTLGVGLGSDRFGGEFSMPGAAAGRAVWVAGFYGKAGPLPSHTTSLPPYRPAAIRRSTPRWGPPGGSWSSLGKRYRWIRYAG